MNNELYWILKYVTVTKFKTLILYASKDGGKAKYKPVSFINYNIQQILLE